MIGRKLVVDFGEMCSVVPVLAIRGVATCWRVRRCYEFFRIKRRDFPRRMILEQSLAGKLGQDAPSCNFPLATSNDRSRINVELYGSYPFLRCCIHGHVSIPSDVWHGQACPCGRCGHGPVCGRCLGLLEQEKQASAPATCAMQSTSGRCCCGPVVPQPVSRRSFSRTSELDRGSLSLLPEVPDCECRPAEPTAASYQARSRVHSASATARPVTTRHFLRSPVPQSRLSEPASQQATCSNYLSIFALRAS